MKTIIISSDFSEEAKNATKYAIGIAKKIEAKLVLFHLHIVSVHAVQARLPYKDILKSIDYAKTKVEDRVKKLSETYDIDIKVDFAMGGYFQQLKRAIAEHHADMMVMGMHVKSIENDLLGSTTSEAINKVQIPILAVPVKAEFKDVQKILFACDLEKGITTNIVKEIKKTTKKFNAELRVLHVNDKITELKNNKEILEPLEEVSYFYKSVQSEAVIDEIKNEMIEYKPDILIMIPYEYGFWSSLIHKSKTRMMSSGLDIPLLSIHA
ncbi:MULTISPECIES: universal stress protein [unclassified Algibacter]|uniref:universal stress protein n=1 Tax=unclassified Algibacter TaxID=2615009 RepID=UPI00131B3E58|nr:MULTISPECIES: universal stress protein [unclassified Algibacter]MCL5127822.1 universal stress protein [Algibacter sp. L4_22]